jgi:hypothetical protein
MHRVGRNGASTAAITASANVAGWGGGEHAIQPIRQSGQRIQQVAQQVISELGHEAQNPSCR